MQNKGAIRIFAILIGLICVYQLMFTYQANETEKDAREYANQRAINSMRISLGTARDTTIFPAGINMALGFRMTFCDKADFATDQEETVKILQQLRKFRNSVAKERSLFIAEYF